MSENSIRFRFLITFSTNLLQSLLSFFRNLVLARHLGPSDYRNFHFLTASFTSILNLIDLSSLSVFYTFISQQKRSKRFFLYYTIWIFVQFVLALLMTLFSLVALKERIWLGHTNNLIILALCSSFAMIRF